MDINIILSNNIINTKYKILITKNQKSLKISCKNNEDKIWNFFFRTERQCFSKKNYSLQHMIDTDGISCSILFA